MKSSYSALLCSCAGLLLIGCAGSPPLFDPKDTQGPPADFSGAWFLGGFWSLDVHQQGESVEVLPITAGLDKRTCEGTVKGRIMSLNNHNVAMTLSPDGTKGTLRMSTNPLPLEYVRRTRADLVLGPAKDDPRVRKERPILTGGRLYRLPAGADGTPSFTMRHADTLLGVFAAGTKDPALFKSLGDWSFRDIIVTRVRYPTPPALLKITKRPTFDILNYRVMDDPTGKGVSSIMGSTLLPRCVAEDLNRVLSSAVISKQSIEGDETPFWFVLAPRWKEGGVAELVGAWCEVYRQDPKGDPVEIVEIAKREADGTWKSIRQFLQKSSMLIELECAIENGQPAGVRAKEAKEPPLEDFLVVKEYCAETALWRNRVLLLVKNRTLPGILKTLKTAELKPLIERIEKMILDVNREIALCNDEAQRLMAVGKADDGKTPRDLALAYKERIEILKPILAAIKEEVVNREK